MRRFALAGFTAAILTLALGGAASSYAPLPLPAWVVSGGASGGTVEAIALSGATAYIGGDFAYMGPETGSAVSLDTGTGALTPGWPTVGGDVYAVAPDGLGGWFIGGAFASVGMRHADNIGHIESDGTLDTGFAAGTDGPVYTLAVSGGTLFAGGFFDTASGQPRAKLAGFDTTTGAATAFNPGVTGTQPLVSALELSGTTLYVGGAFAGLGGQARQNLGAVKTDTGVVVPSWNPRPDALVNAIAVGGDGTVYVGGFFDTVNGTVARLYAAAFDASGTATGWHPVPNAEVYAIEVSGSKRSISAAPSRP